MRLLPNGDRAVLDEARVLLAQAPEMGDLRRRLERDEGSVGFLGADASRAESTESHRALRELEAMSAELDDPNLAPERRANLAAAEASAAPGPWHRWQSMPCGSLLGKTAARPKRSSAPVGYALWQNMQS